MKCQGRKCAHEPQAPITAAMVAADRDTNGGTMEMAKARLFKPLVKHSPQCVFEHFCAVNDLPTDRTINNTCFASKETENAWRAYCWGAGIGLDW